MNYDKKILLKLEGEKVAKETKGFSKFGVIHNTEAEAAACTLEKAVVVFKQHSPFPDGTDELAIIANDFGYHSGKERAIRYMQRIVLAEPDGVLGPVTLAAIEKYGRQKLALQLLIKRCVMLGQIKAVPGLYARIGKLLAIIGEQNVD